LEERRLQTSRFFTVDLTKINGKGDFSCPRCGTKISPDDRSEKVYKILEAHMRGDELDSIMLQCNKCESQIYLTGFRALSMTR
jgi:DNA-directed RNA polymerase subunit RPC12/RpoP